MTPKEIADLKTATIKLTRWDSSKKAFGHYKVIEAKRTDRIYEFWCLMKILQDLRINYDIELIPNSVGNGIFPQSSAKKKGYAYFKIKHKTIHDSKFQICYGTKIKLSGAPKTTHAPDISVQIWDSTEDPDENMVQLIMDAKYKEKDGTIPVSQIHEIMQRITALNTKNADKINLHFDKLKPLLGNCLLTNGKGLKDQKEYCVLFQVKQVEHFGISMPFNVIG